MCSYCSISMDRYLLVGKEKRDFKCLIKICTIDCLIDDAVDDDGSSIPGIGFVLCSSKKGENTSFLINAHSILYENKSYYA